MKVICAGLMKTGTTSMGKALQILGYKTYDYMEHFFFHLKPWSAVFVDKKKPDFLSMYSDVDAVVDMPPNVFYKEILQSFPDAKVILTERDNEDDWLQSWFTQIDQNKTNHRGFFAILKALSPTMRKGIKTGELCLKFIFGTGRLHERGSSFLLKKKYREYNEQVKASVPSDQLLVFNVKQGWRPLCEFLGCIIPSCPFPRENVKGSRVKEQQSPKGIFSSHFASTIAREVIISISLIVLLVSVVLILLHFK